MSTLVTSPSPPIRVPFEAQAFPSSLSIPTAGGLKASWNDILWAAVTVGRPCRYCVFRHGNASAYEAIFRWSLVRMALQQSGVGVSRLQRTEAYKTLDPTEKGSVSYFLGLTFCKLFATNFLDTPWLLHLDVFGDRYRPLLVGRSRPDLVGKSNTSREWSVFECKGRGTKPDNDTKQEAKRQARRLTKFDGSKCSLHVCAITYFAGDELNFFWADPPAGDEPIEITSRDEDWRDYYLPLVQFFRLRGGFDARGPDKYLALEVPEFDLRIEIAQLVADLLRREQWNAAREHATSHANDLKISGFQPDGLRIIAGESWRAKLEWPSQ